MDDIFDLILNGFYQVLTWMDTINYNGISVLHVSFLLLFFSLMWRFILSPVFGASAGSLSAGVSDIVSKVRNSSKTKESKK